MLKQIIIILRVDQVTVLFLGFTHVTNSLATVTIRHLDVPQA